jgi:hypothetical protein
MTALALMARSVVRQRVGALVGFAVLLAVGLGGAIAAFTRRGGPITVVGVGLVIGIPAGLVLGTITWRGFAGGLGIRDAPIVSTLWIGIVVVGAIALSLLASAGPSRYASRVAPSTVLREK